MQIISLLLVRQAFSMCDSKDLNNDQTQMSIAFLHTSLVSFPVILPNLELIGCVHVSRAI